MRLTLLHVLTASALCLPALAWAQTDFSGIVPAPADIPDGLRPQPASYGAPLDVRFPVTGMQGTVTAVSVRFRAEHPWVGELRVELVAPDGSHHLLFERTGTTVSNTSSSNANLHGGSEYTFADSASTHWWTAAQIGDANIPSVTSRTVLGGGPGAPNPPPATSFLTALSGAAPNGVWRLRFQDGVQGNTGQVIAATLTLGTAGNTYTVNTATDGNDGSCDANHCSLREALTVARSSDRIDFAEAMFGNPQTIALQSPLPELVHRITIDGPGARLLTVARDVVAPEFRIFNILSVADLVRIEGLTLRDGRTAGNGGGIRSQARLVLSGLHVRDNLATEGGGVELSSNDGLFTGSTFAGNTATFNGGGIRFGQRGNLRIEDSTISGNAAGQDGGGIYQDAFSSDSGMVLTSVTIAGNSATGSGGGVLVASNFFPDRIASALLRNTLLAGNTPVNLAIEQEAGIAGISSMGFNLSSGNSANFLNQPSDRNLAAAQLAPLADNGGSVPTHALNAGSLALDAGSRFGRAEDQRGPGFDRTVDLPQVSNASASDGTDIGALEMQPAPVLPDPIFANGFETN